MRKAGSLSEKMTVRKDLEGLKDEPREHMGEMYAELKEWLVKSHEVGSW